MEVEHRTYFGPVPWVCRPSAQSSNKRPGCPETNRSIKPLCSNGQRLADQTQIDPPNLCAATSNNSKTRLKQIHQTSLQQRATARRPGTIRAIKLLCSNEQRIEDRAQTDPSNLCAATSNGSTTRHKQIHQTSVQQKTTARRVGPRLSISGGWPSALTPRVRT